MRLIVFLIFFTATLLQAYEMGRGYKLYDELHVGGYFSTDYSVSKDEEIYRLDDVALLAYGSFTDEFSYLVELEAAPFYTYDFETDEGVKDSYFHKERLYVDYKYSQNLNFRLGKQITPIGYWNLEPINVLRETSSNPLLSSKMFPKFVSGVDIYGYVPSFDSLKYHIYGQKNKDLDEDYINIENEHFYGISLENELSFDFQYGGSVGEFISKDDKRSRFASLNFKYEDYPFKIQSEAVYSNIKNLNSDKTDYSFATYVQSTYKLNEQNILVGRYEYFEDKALRVEQNIGLIGYSYRPIYSVSLKGEYQVNSHSDLNKFIISFSVLF